MLPPSELRLLAVWAPALSDPSGAPLTVRLHPLASRATITVTIRGASAHRSATVIPDRPLTTLGIILPTQAAWAWWVERHDAAKKKSGAESAA